MSALGAVAARIRADLWERPARNVPGLDGLRAWGCASIVFFHCALFTGVIGAERATGELRVLQLAGQGAWTGVDVFFVLSGFLIGRILLAERAATGGVRYGGFYLRRALRIFPAHYVVLAVAVLVLAPWNVGNLLFFTGAPDWRTLAATAWTNAVYLNNYLAVGRPNVLGWGWSLCVEEHFYLLLPPLLAAAFALRSTARMALLAAAVLVPVAGRAAALGAGADSIATGAFYYFSHNRFDQLMIGVLIAYGWVFHRAAFARAVGRAGPALWLAGLVAVALVWRFGGLQHRGVFPVVFQLPMVAAGAGLLLVNALFADNVATRVLAHRGWYPLARVSYGTYLVHPYVLFWAITRLRGPLGLDVVHAPNLLALYAVVLGLSWAVASVLFVGLERPLLDLGGRLAARPAPRPAERRATTG